MCVCCVLDPIWVWAQLILNGSFIMTCVLVTSLHLVSIEACVSAVETQFGGAGYMCVCADGGGGRV